MATATLVTVSEYLRSAYEPDAEFVDGHIEERPMGQRDHSDLQRRLLIMLNQPEFLGYFVCTAELRMQVSADRFRVPDLCLLDRKSPREQVVVTPPILCIEILSPEDSTRRTLVRVREFLAMGVPEVWVFDPESRTVQICVGTSIKEQANGSLTVPGTSVEVDLAEVFSVLDQ